MEDALPIAVEARADARNANKRLDRMNGSIDSLVKEVKDVNSKVDTVLMTLAGEAGAAKARESFVVSRRFVLTICVALMGTSLVTFVATLILRGGRP